jgi:peptidoglycan/LPS O-acetylase OafA/YrhL
MSTTTAPTSKRIEALDYLRGFFILVIIVDHLWRWPNMFEYISGRGELWVSAAEGFVIISGLLVGYVRGRKGLKKSFTEISKKLVLRGLMLYIWTIITAIALVGASWYLSFKSSVAYIPYDKFDWANMIRDTLTFDYAHILTHFLYLYAIFLVLSPILVWLLRKGFWWIGGLISIGMWWYGFTFDNEWMQWQILFYLPAIAGFYLDQIIAFFRRVPSLVIWTVVAAGLGSIIFSALIVLPYDPSTYKLGIFSREPLMPARIGLSFLWFVALAWLFNRILPFLEKTVGWLLLPFGTKSLTAYIVHSFVLMGIALVLPSLPGFWQNTILACVAILITWAIVKLPGINRVIPR